MVGPRRGPGRGRSTDGPGRAAPADRREAGRRHRRSDVPEHQPGHRGRARRRARRLGRRHGRRHRRRPARLRRDRVGHRRRLPGALPAPARPVAPEARRGAAHPHSGRGRRPPGPHLGVAEPFGMKSRRFVWREPVGVVGAITPWNYPNQINIAKVVPALAAGNTVVLKPAPDTPWTGLFLGRLIAEETDIPPGVVNVVTSSDHLLGQQLSEDPRVDMITFTGSTATGRKVMAAGAATVKKVFLELGGKSASVALDDADIGATAAGVCFAITSHAGQGCAITSRYLLPRSRYEEGLEAVTATLGSIAYGDPTDPANLMGPLISERQRTR